jgi:hypothetical protein
MGRSAAIRKILGRDFNRGLVSVRGHGVRATTDSDDYANTQLRQDANKYEGARQKLVASRARVDTKSMKDKELRDWVEQGVSKVLAAHNDRLARLLLPPGEESKDEGKK